MGYEPTHDRGNADAEPEPERHGDARDDFDAELDQDAHTHTGQHAEPDQHGSTDQHAKPDENADAVNTNPFLSILCVTRAEPHAARFLGSMLELAKHCDAELVVAADGLEAFERVLDLPRLADEADVVMVTSRGFIESVLDYAIESTHGDWILRLDDDERVNGPMGAWLQERAYLHEPHWSFRRLNLWGDEKHALDTSLLFPDPQTRLSRRELAGGRRSIHVASPHGLGRVAPQPVALEHHKFLVKSLDQRREVAARYERAQPGSGSGVFRYFYEPEECYTPEKLSRHTVPVERLLQGLGGFIG